MVQTNDDKDLWKHGETKKSLQKIKTQLEGGARGFLQARRGGKFIPFESQGVLSGWFQRKLDVVINVTLTLSLVPRYIHR